ncbi:DNA replication/repair protein RecF [Picosynechococcus sp. PCC 11901]|uniref:DNA replication/repair protein RecF n=1 Tax=Picosynechococcus sp. PCC 11901 TaxID=2579791 RepID=UPI0010FC373E|nr:DNA replication/repair protein RecF [Picosynechococcus sp. PCC 11901]QCS50745.1 DNA replication/repair protein RecF [Picosynechococcus sp. PCC 11901]
MYLQTLHLRNFRNYQHQHVDFSAQKTILIGNNAQGKSNLLEAVELLASLKTHRTSRDADLVKQGEATARIQAQIQRGYGTVDFDLLLRNQGGRTLKLNGETLRRQLDGLGTLNAVEFSCLDLDLVRGGPDCRRQWIDNLLIQLEPVYARILQEYQQVLKQRNALLRTAKKLHRNQAAIPTDLTQQLTLWDLQLAATGSRVTRRRSRGLLRLMPLAQAWHRDISSQTETLEITYCPNIPWQQDDPHHVQQACLDKIEQRRQAEQHQGSSMVGPHRDEIEFSINGTPARFYGSQGQQRTLVLALKLAELQLIETIIGEPPLLLLDDVLAELDPSRQNQLLDTIQTRFQTLITTTHLNSFGADWLKHSQILTVNQGTLQPYARPLSETYGP